LTVTVLSLTEAPQELISGGTQFSHCAFEALWHFQSTYHGPWSLFKSVD